MTVSSDGADSVTLIVAPVELAVPAERLRGPTCPCRERGSELAAQYQIHHAVGHRVGVIRGASDSILEVPQVVRNPAGWSRDHR